MSNRVKKSGTSPAKRSSAATPSQSMRELEPPRFTNKEVEIEYLSTGAKEQLAILIRLALTQIVQVGEPFPVILDDEFAHSDPDRIAMMNNIFNDFGDDQQFIMLTCTPEKFTGYNPVKTINLAALRGA
jgi:uncharacterized protein YhaN